MIYCYYVNGSNSLILAYNLGDEINEKCLRFKALGGDGRTITPKYHRFFRSLLLLQHRYAVGKFGDVVSLNLRAYPARVCHGKVRKFTHRRIRFELRDTAKLRDEGVASSSPRHYSRPHSHGPRPHGLFSAYLAPISRGCHPWLRSPWCTPYGISPHKHCRVV
jgi:hypothetical protein